MCALVYRSSPILITLFEPCIREPVKKKDADGAGAGDGEEQLGEMAQSPLSLPGGSGDEADEANEEEHTETREGTLRGSAAGRAGSGRVQYRAVHRSADT
jgi:hypothetical protein